MTARLRCNRDKKIFGVLYREGDVVKKGGTLRKLLIKEGFTEVKKTSKKVANKKTAKKMDIKKKEEKLKKEDD